MIGLCRSALALSAVLSAGLSAQVVDRVIPNAAAPGDLITIQGTDLDGLVTTIDFTADVGGIPGVYTLSVVPIKISSTEVTAMVPTLGFAPPAAARPGQPMGSVRVTADEISSNELRLFYTQPTLFSPVGRLSTPGMGTTQSNGDRAVVSFDLDEGPPTPGNNRFMMELENALPSVGAVLMLGSPGGRPFPRIGDGDFVLSGEMPIIFLPPVLTDGVGDASFRVPIPGPGPFGLTVTAQWVIIDSALTGGVAVSNGLSFTL